MVIVPDEAEKRERLRRRHEQFSRLEQGKSERYKRRARRIEMLETGQDVPRVRVLPKNDRMREILVHPNGNLAFPQGGGSVEWPLDQFTLRRLRDGDVMLDPSVEQQVYESGAGARSRRLGGGSSPAGTATSAAIAGSARSTDHHEYERMRAERERQVAARRTPPPPPVPKVEEPKT